MSPDIRLVAMAILFVLETAFIFTGGLLTGFALDIPGRYHRTEGMCTVGNGIILLISFQLYFFSSLDFVLLRIHLLTPLLLSQQTNY